HALQRTKPFPRRRLQQQGPRTESLRGGRGGRLQGEEVSVESFLRLLTGRTLPGTPPSKMLATDEHSNVLIYMN
ncbi:unnamed protein product, partial [Ascophyllum nodosum]